MKLTSADQLTYIWLRLFTEDQGKLPGKFIWPGYETMTGLIRVNRKTVANSINKLKQLKILSIDTPQMVPNATVIKVYDIAVIGKRKSKAKTTDLPVLTGNLCGADIDWICENNVNMAMYLRYGQSGIRATAMLGLVSTRFDWTMVDGWSRDNEHPELWDASQFAGYYWFLVAWHRNCHGKTIQLPNWTILLKEMNAAMRRFSGPQLYERMKVMVTNFPLISKMTGRLAVELTESSLSNSIIGEKLQAIQLMSIDERNALLNGNPIYRAIQWLKRQTQPRNQQ